MPSMTTYNVIKVTTETDHKPLITFVKKPLHAVPSCPQCMLLELQPLVHVQERKTAVYSGHSVTCLH